MAAQPAIANDPSCQLRKWSSEEIAMASQGQIEEEIDIVLEEISGLRNYMRNLVGKIVLVDHIKGKLGTIDLGKESGQVEARIAALQLYYGKLRQSWREKGGLEA